MDILIPFPYAREGGGGIANFISNFSRHAAKLGHRVTVVTTRTAGEKSEERKNGVKFIRIVMPRARILRRLRDYTRFGRRVQAMLRSGTLAKPDVILGVSYAATAGIGGPLAYRSAGGPVHWEFQMWKRLWHDGLAHAGIAKRLAVQIDFALQERLERTCVRAAKALLCQSDAIADGFRKAYAPSAPVHMPCTGVDTKQFAPRSSSLKKKLGINGPMLLFVGGFSAPKGGPVLERSLPALFNEHPDARLVIAGPESYTMRLASPYAEKVMHLGHQAHDSLPAVYNAADVFVFPSVFNEGFPNAVLEAMSSGTPIVTTKMPGVEEYLKNGESALIVEPYDAGALANAVSRLLHDRKLASRLGKNARKASLRFDWKRVTAEMCVFLARVFRPARRG
jgi:glycosyltransferase involved in cell wall biosynthesis